MQRKKYADGSMLGEEKGFFHSSVSMRASAHAGVRAHVRVYAHMWPYAQKSNGE